MKPYVERVCHGGKHGRRCRNVTIPLRMNKKQYEKKVIERMRREIKYQINRRRPKPGPKKNKTKN